MPGKYADLNKKANDALTKGFDNNHSVKVTTKGGDVTYTAQVNSKGNNKVAGKLGLQFSHKSGFNVKKFEVANNGTLTSQVHLTGAVDRTTFTLDVVMKPLDLSAIGEKCVVGLEYAHDKAHVTLGVSPLLPTAAEIAVLAAPVDNVLVGASYAGELQETWTHKANSVGLGYSANNATLTLTGANNLSNFTLGGFFQHSKDLSFASNLGISRANPSQASITVGANYNVDADTSVKAKVDVPNGSTDGATASLGFNQRLNNNVRLTAASTIQLDHNEDLFGASFALGLEFGNV